MFDIIFTKKNEKGEPTTMMKVGSVPSESSANDKMTSMFVDFCRDVSKKPLTRQHYVNGFEWMYRGLVYSLHYISTEEKGVADGQSS